MAVSSNKSAICGQCIHVSQDYDALVTSNDTMLTEYSWVYHHVELDFSMTSFGVDSMISVEMYS